MQTFFLHKPCDCFYLCEQNKNRIFVTRFISKEDANRLDERRK